MELWLPAAIIRRIYGKIKDNAEIGKERLIRVLGWV